MIEIGSIGVGDHIKNFFFSFTSGGHYVHWCEIILSILEESHIGNIPVKFD